MEAFSPREDQQPSLLERSIRATAGIGVGFGAYWTYKTQYGQLRKKLISSNLADGVKRTFERHFAFTNVAQEMTEFEKRLGIKSFIEVIPPKSDIERELDAMARKRRQIGDALGRTQRTILRIEEAATAEGADPKIVGEFKATFEDFRDNYLQRAISTTETLMGEEFSGKGAQEAEDILRSARWDQIQQVNQQMTVVLDRVRVMQHKMETLKDQVTSIGRSSMRRVERELSERGSAGPQDDKFREAARNIERNLMTAGQDVKSLSDLTPTSFPVTPSRPMSTRYWTIKSEASDLRRDMSLQKMIGADAYRSISETVRESYRDPYLPAHPADERLKTAEFMRHIRDTVRSLQNSTASRDGKTFKQFKKIDVAISDELNKVVVIRAKAADPRAFGTDDLVLRYEVPKTQLGAKYMQKNGKEFFVPYSRQNDVLMRQTKAYLAKTPWEDALNGGSAQETADKIQQTVLNNSLMFGKSTLSDLMMSARVDQRITHEMSKVYESGFENFNKVLRNKIARGGILHIDVKSATRGGMPTQISWVLKDALGREVDAHFFSIGKGGAHTPAHLIGKRMGGHEVSKWIPESEVSQVVEALSTNLNDPRMHGHPIQVAFSGAESKVSSIEELMRLAERGKGSPSNKIAMIRAAVQEQTVIDVNNIGAVTGEVVGLSGANLFRLMRDQVSGDPELTKMVNEKLMAIGIPGLNEIGQETFEKGLHNTFQDAYMQSLFPEVMYLAMRKKKRGFYKAFQEELKSVADGYIPKRFMDGIIDMDKFNSARHELMRNVSPTSWLKGSLDPTDTNLAGWFPDLRAGRGDRTLFSMGTHDLKRKSVERRLRRQLARQGKNLDPGLAAKEVLNDIQTKMIVMLDAGQTNIIGKEEFAMADRMRKFSFSSPYTEIVDKLDRNIKVGSEVGFAAGRFSVIGQRGPEPVQFRSLDKASNGVVREIATLPNGQLAVTIDRTVKLGANTPVLGPQAGLISAKGLEEIFPHVGPKFGFATAASYLEKNNPGVMLTDMFSFLFDFAGTDPKKKAAVYSAFRKRLRQKAADPMNPRFFPLTEKMGQITFSGGTMDFWREMNKRIGIEDYIHIAEDVNLQLNGSFVPTRIFLDGTRPQRRDLVDITNGTLMAHAKMMNNQGALEANVRIAMSNLRRETNPDEVLRIANQAGEFLKQGTINSVFEAMKITRPDVVAQLQAEGKEVTPRNFFDKVPSYGGFVKDKSGNYVFATVRQGPLNLSDISVFSGIGELKRGNIGFNFVQAVQNLHGSQDLVDHLVKTMYDQNAIQLARAFPHAIATGAVKTPQWMSKKTAAETAAMLKKWVNLPNTKGLVGQGWIPAEAMYEVHGVAMTETKAMQELGISRLRFKKAIEEGIAKPLNDVGDLGRRIMHPKDLDEIKRLQPFVMEFGRTMGVQVEGTSQLAAHDRMMISAATDEDYHLMPFKNTRTGEIKTFALEAPHMAKLREFMHSITAGAYVDPTGRNGLSSYHQYLELLGKRVLKQEMKARIDTMDIPVVRLNAFATTEVDLMSVTTKAKAIETIRSTLGVRKLGKDLFLKARGIMPDEGLLIGDDQVFDRILKSMSWDDMRSSANRMLGNVQMGDRSGLSPRSFALRYLGRDIKEMGGSPHQYMADALGVLENIVNTKEKNNELVRKFYKYASEGVYPVPMMGAKYPLADQSKFVGGWFFRAQTDADQKVQHGTGTGRIGVAPFNSLVEGNIDADKDIIQFLMSHREKYMNIIKKNKFLSDINPMNVVVEKEKGMVTLYNNVTGTFSKVPMPIAVGSMGFDKAATVESEVITKQFAGQVTVMAENVRQYMQRMLSGKGSGLAHDLGQMDPGKINLQVWEATGAMIEGILKGKAGNSSTQTVSDMLSRFGEFKVFERFAKDVADPTHPSYKQFQKVTHKIQGTEHVWPESGGMSTLEIILESMRSGRGSKDMFASLVPEEKIMGTAMSPNRLYGMRGAMVEAMNRMFITQGIPTRYNTIAQESLLKSIKKNVQNDLGEQTWRNVSKGMGWAAGVGAVFLAANIFNKDELGFLGNRPGTGTEQFDWTFTHPEYKMANLLDVPYNNPYDQKRTYVTMDNPMSERKAQQLSKFEQRDMIMIHEAISNERIRDVVSGPGVSRSDHRRTLERFGHV